MWPVAVDFHGKPVRTSNQTDTSKRQPNKRGAQYGRFCMTKPTSIARLERVTRALELRRDGKSYSQIMTIMQLSSQGMAYGLVKQGLDAIKAECAETAEQLREVELQRMDSLWETMHEMAKQGDDKAASVCVKISARRAALLGLDKPQQITHTIAKTYAVGDASPDCPTWPATDAELVLPDEASESPNQDEEGDE